MHPDSYDWLTNGLRYAGVPVMSSWRVVLAPFVYAALFALRLENLIPFLGLVVVLGTAGMLLTLGWRAAGMAAVWAAALLAANHLVLGHALSIQPDVWSAGLGLTGLLAFAVALDARRPALLYGAATAFVLGGLAQPATPFLAPACLLMLLDDPGAPHGVGLRPLRWLLGTRQAWGALALAGGILAAAFVLRWALIGVPWPETVVRHGAYVVPRFVPALVGFYAWASLADWSVPVTLLAVLGAVRGLRERWSRRLTLGLLAAVAGNAAVFVLLYTTYRENRFVVYWTMPVLLLAGLGIRSLRPGLALVAGVLAVVATNMTVGHWARPGTEPVLALSNTWVLEARYSTLEHDWTVERLDKRAHGFRKVLGRWVRYRRNVFGRRDQDDLHYSRTRELMGRLAAFHVRRRDPLFLHFAPDRHPTHVYMQVNQLALYARRRTQGIVLDRAPALPGLRGRGAVVLLLRRELDRLQAAHLLAWPVQVLEERGPYVLVRLGGPASQDPTPASSRKMSSSERVSSHPG